MLDFIEIQKYFLYNILRSEGGENMRLFNRVKEKSEKSKSNANIYAELGIVEPFTVLAGGQFNSFIGELSENKHGVLNQTEQEALKQLWYAAGIDIGGTGDNIWNLKNGSFEIYNKDGVTIRYEKKTAEVKDKYSSDSARANFVYLSRDGSFVINQNDRNQKVFLVYVSEDITDRLLRVLSEAEIEALDLEPESIQRKNRVGIPSKANIPTITTRTKPSTQINGTQNNQKRISGNVLNRDEGER